MFRYAFRTYVEASSNLSNSSSTIPRPVTKAHRKPFRPRLFPFIDTAPRATPPVIVISLITANTLVFLWMWSLPPSALDRVLVHLALIPLRYSDPVSAVRLGLDPHNWWPLLTNTFMHGGWLHLIVNMWFLWIFGPAMEGRFGRIGFLCLYLIGGLVASIVDVIAQSSSTEAVLGASGAIAAVIAAYAVTYPSARVITIVPLGFVPLFLPVPAILFGLIWFGLQVVQGTSALTTPGLATGIAWWAHIGGFAFGAAFALIANHMTSVDHTVPPAASTARSRRVPDIKPHNWDQL
jgi:membrane associated rhomboid family serine protease